MTKLPKPGLWTIGYQHYDEWVQFNVLICGQFTDLDRDFYMIPVLYDGEYWHWKESKTGFRKSWKPVQENNETHTCKLDTNMI